MKEMTFQVINDELFLRLSQFARHTQFGILCTLANEGGASGD